MSNVSFKFTILQKHVPSQYLLFIPYYIHSKYNYILELKTNYNLVIFEFRLQRDHVDLNVNSIYILTF